jgi:hypothetical protein
MKKSILIAGIVLTSLSGFAQDDHSSHGENSNKTEVKKKSLSPHTSAMAMVGDAHVHIDYSSPSVRERIIFGGLVGYNTVWQAGAHKATWLETNKDLIINGQTLSTGKYGFFVVPGKDEWKVMFNSHWDQHGKDEYNSKQDVLTLKVKPETLKNIQESLEYKVTEVSKTEGEISLAWEKVKITIPFKLAE